MNCMADTYKYGICNISHAPVRETISHASEMKTELLFGDFFEIRDRYMNWLKIENAFDGYEGWVDEKQIQYLTEEEFAAHKADKTQCFTSGFMSEIQRHSNHDILRVGVGCRLPLYKDGVFKLGSQVYSYQGDVLEPEDDAENRRRAVVNLASLFINTPYLWGGKSSFAADCSGFTQLLYRIEGVNLLRDSSQQATQGTNINLLAEAKAGDLLFFDNENEQIVHVGIYNGNGLIIHSSGLVRIDPVDHEGIFKQEISTYSHHLRLIRRVLE